ncbi:MAG: molybdate ABC transporter substrate-binding protein [Solirubrobacteraceae bacterium]|nr:molybdate ABC transporter substrate-binding protein [Solirubrobacteraceae bacterium]
MRSLRPLALAAAAVLAAAAPGCGGEDPARGDASGAGAPLTVLAAASLREALPAIDPAPRYGFGSSGTLATQIRRGAPADVFLSASPDPPAALHAEGRCSAPVAFATNRLVLVVPRDGRVRGLDDLRAGGLRVAIGGPGVPAGDYARALLRQIGAEDVLAANRVSRERDVAGVAAKVAYGSADAGFAYATDARAAGDRVRTVPLPREQPARYALCVVRDGPAARAFVDAVRSPEGRAVLRAHGFGLP